MTDLLTVTVRRLPTPEEFAQDGGYVPMTLARTAWFATKGLFAHVEADILPLMLRTGANAVGGDHWSTTKSHEAEDAAQWAREQGHPNGGAHGIWSFEDGSRIATVSRPWDGKKRPEMLLHWCPCAQEWSLLNP